jgi:nitrogen fixation protein NifQ
MTPKAIYATLIEFNVASGGDAFDGHVLASILTVAAMESGSGRSLAYALGIAGDELRRLIERYFPGALALLEPFGLDGDLAFDDDEQCLRELLARTRSVSGPIGSLLSILIARRCTRPNHLWQDLGLRNRGELSTLMLRHFRPLAMRNTLNMKWKKFLYRTICRDEGYRLCAAPCCSECSDIDNCFGDESGESMLARARNLFESQGFVLLSTAGVQ